MKPRLRVAKRLRDAFLLIAINIAIFAAVDLALVKLDLLSPPFEHGDSQLGFGKPGVRRSVDLGVTRVANASDPLTLAMVGDSHSELWFDNVLDSHEFVLERTLRAEEVPIEVISAGRGRYSPFQEYLLFKRDLEEDYHPRILLMNLYAGNDFYDMLRPDDRPHFARDERNAIVTKDPLWISYVDPNSRNWVERSRLLWAVDEVASRLGFPRVATRLRMFTATMNRSDRLGDSWRYLSALRRSQEPRLGYPAGFAAQILNQALFFRYFPESQAESIAYLRVLLQRARAENPDLLLVLTAIPSAAAMGAIPHDLRQPWLDTLARTGLDERWVADLENTFVGQLGPAATEAGWLFIDLRPCLRSAPASEQLYSSFDLHINVAASKRIGECQARALLADPRFRSIGLHASGLSHQAE